jgi:CrcB protein
MRQNAFLYRGVTHDRFRANAAAMIQLFLVMVGGAFGTAARYLVGRGAVAAFGPTFPYGTLAVNVIGGFAMGVLAGVLARVGGNENTRLLLGVGVLGGFTTFSSFSLEVVTMVERDAWATALGYVLASVLGAVLALFAGLWLTRIAA